MTDKSEPFHLKRADVLFTSSLQLYLIGVKELFKKTEMK